MTSLNPSDPTGAIVCRELGLYRDNFPALHSISLNIAPGSVVGLIGRNGAGKSTLLRLLAGLITPSSGSSFLLGCPSGQLTEGIRAQIGYVAQTPDLFEWMTVQEHLTLIGRAYPTWDERRCFALAVRMNLSLGRTVAKLSGGDQQKLAVVLALAHDPTLLLLDEPVASLDPMTRRDFMRSLFSDREVTTPAGTQRIVDPTVIISSHLLGDLERVVSHVAFLRDGALQLYDSWDNVLEHFRLAPAGTAGLDRAAIVHRNHANLVLDTRHAPAWATLGRPLSLDELFVALNT
jgi:ABC-2 type transport system ATP-binding protein